ncbi:MAG TPA: hypothetical protein PLV13_04960 [Ilumatobacteraceae bacterium]|nr:hypothetical protein [Ilumatobacteraceae bacterium]
MNEGVHVKRKMVGAVALLASTVFVPVVSSATTVLADGPGVGTPWVVSLGDSYISGEGGRWAGNSNSSSASVDAGGSAAYYDNATHTAETINRCHRSTAAEIHIGGGVNSLNLACSGAKTSTFTSSDGYFKPGIDFYNSGGNQGQALMLQNFAATHNVKMVQLSIGGNNFNFADIIQSCVSDFLLSPSWWKDYCNDDSSVVANFTAANITAQQNAITGAINNVKTAMANAGYTTAQYKIVVQTYPSPIPNGTGFRYSESGYTRQSTGGCGFWNNDANWANATALVKINNAVKGAATTANSAGNVVVLDLAAAFNGRRLCENTVNLMENSGKANWTVAGASDATEWIAQIRTVSTVFGPYYVQESLHPNWWGEKAIRNCVRQAYNGGNVRGGVCNRGTGLNANGEPNMTLV